MQWSLPLTDVLGAETVRAHERLPVSLWIGRHLSLGESCELESGRGLRLAIQVPRWTSLLSLGNKVGIICSVLVVSPFLVACVEVCIVHTIDSRHGIV